MKTITMSYEEYVKEIEELKKLLESKETQLNFMSVAAKEYKNKGSQLLKAFQNYIEQKENLPDWQQKVDFIEKLVPSADLFWK